MKWRQVLTVVLLVVAAAAAAFLASLLVRIYAAQELEAICASLQAVVFVFTAAAGLLALLKYWDSVEAKTKESRWHRFDYLEKSFERFRERHLNVIQAFDWSHILQDDYLPLCKRAVDYDQTDSTTERKDMFTAEELERIRQLDDFLEYFENLHFAVSRRLVSVADLMVFLRYYILELLDKTYRDPNDPRLREYVETYYYNIPDLLRTCREATRARGP